MRTIESAVSFLHLLYSFTASVERLSPFLMVELNKEKAKVVRTYSTNYGEHQKRSQIPWDACYLHSCQAERRKSTRLFRHSNVYQQHCDLHGSCASLNDSFERGTDRNYCQEPLIQPRSQGPLSSFLLNVNWLRLVTCECEQIKSRLRMGLDLILSTLKFRFIWWR